MPDGDAFRVLLAKMLRQRVSEKAPASWKQVIFCRPARRNLWCRFGGGRGFQRDHISRRVYTAPLPKPGPKAQQQIVLTSDPFKTAVLQWLYSY
jgi:hypothetical protein